MKAKKAHLQAGVKSFTLSAVDPTESKGMSQKLFIKMFALILLIAWI